MYHNPYDQPAQNKSPKWRPTVSFSITAAVLLLLLILFVASGAFGAYLVILGIVALLTALFGLVFKRRSWIGLRNGTAAKGTALGGVLVFVLGLVIAGTSATGSDKLEPADGTVTATPSPSASMIANTECDVEDARRGVSGETYLCTEDEDGVLVWMDRDSHDEVVAAALAAQKAEKEAAAAKAAEEKKAAEAARKKAAAEKAAAQKKAAAEKAAAEKKAAAKKASGRSGRRKEGRGGSSRG